MDGISSNMNEEIERLRSIVSYMEESIPKLIEGARRPLLEEIAELRKSNEQLSSLIFPDEKMPFPRKCRCDVRPPCPICVQWAHNYLKEHR
jgi:hypothetical protein